MANRPTGDTRTVDPMRPRWVGYAILRAGYHPT